MRWVVRSRRHVASSLKLGAAFLVKRPWVCSRTRVRISFPPARHLRSQPGVLRAGFQPQEAECTFAAFPLLF